MLGSLFNKVARPKTPTQVFSCEYCEYFKNSLFYRTTLVAAFALGGVHNPALQTFYQRAI